MHVRPAATSAATARAVEQAVFRQARGRRGRLAACCFERAHRGELLPRQAFLRRLAACPRAAGGARQRPGQVQARPVTAPAQARSTERVRSGPGATMRGCSSFPSTCVPERLRAGAWWASSRRPLAWLSHAVVTCGSCMSGFVASVTKSASSCHLLTACKRTTANRVGPVLTQCHAATMCNAS